MKPSCNCLILMDYLLKKAGLEEKDVSLKQNVEKKGLILSLQDMWL